MDSNLQEVADRRLEEALIETEAPDPRPECRALLRELKERGENDYDEAVAEFHELVVRGIAEEEADPLRTWLAFGVRLAARSKPGRTVVIDAAGRSRDFTPPPSIGDLILHLPTARGGRAIAIGIPSHPSSAQQAAADLLAFGKVKRSESEGITTTNQESS